MRRTIFLDNFRGFANTSSPLADVNFLVGENSTGKTSVLNLLRMLSSLGREDEFQLQHFKELVSIHSEDRSYFRVGLNEERAAGSNSSVTGMLISCRDEAGLAKISHVTFSSAR